MCRARAALPSSAVRRAASAPQALAGAAEGDALLLLADSYPWRLSPAPPRALLAQAAAKKLRLYAEYLEDVVIQVMRIDHPTALHMSWKQISSA